VVFCFCTLRAGKLAIETVCRRADRGSLTVDGPDVLNPFRKANAEESLPIGSLAEL
jgi:hypothetical protein